MHEIEEKVKPICEMKEKLISWTKEELDKGKDCVNTTETGDVVDMIKDLADAEKNIWKAAYYKAVVEAMIEYDDEIEVDPSRVRRMGYDNYRYSSGKFAPKGHGHYVGHMGYTPMQEMTRLYHDERDMMHSYPRMGYVDPMDGRYNVRDGYAGSSSDYSPENSRAGGRMNNSRYGMNYDNYQDARRHYTSSHDKKDKDEMDRYANDHVADATMTIKEIWNHADPEMKKKLKADLNSLMTMVNSTP